MPRAALPILAPSMLTLSMLAPGAGVSQVAPGDQLAQLVIRQQILVRVHRPPPIAAARTLSAPRGPVWVEKKGPKCVPVAGLAGAQILQADAVDLVAIDGKRVRAVFDEDCPALDFYAGFYLKQTKDGKVCAGRDAVRARSGRTCEIDKFRTLVAAR